MPPRASTDPRTFFLNEQHELAPGEAKGGGGQAKFGAIDWDERGQRIAKTLEHAARAVRDSADPTGDRRYFLVAVPAPIPKLTTAKRFSRTGEPVEIEVKPDFGGRESLAFRRLGLDLLRVHSDGTATVHMGRPTLDRIVATSSRLGAEGARHQARLSTIHSFEGESWTKRIDSAWLDAHGEEDLMEFVAELQPVLSDHEARQVMNALTERLDRQSRESISKAGTDFSGRAWFAGRARPSKLRALLENFQSIQTIHPPLWSRLAAKKAQRVPRPADATRGSVDVDPSTLPVVGVVDAGVPGQHVSLARFVRGRYVRPGLSAYHGSHGSLVASRVVFGDPDAPERCGPPRCRFYDVMLGETATRIDDKSVHEALNAVVATAPDVRVFNLSFDQDPLGSMGAIERGERLALVQDLDNLIFARDVLVVVSAGNSPRGVVPVNQYPGHFEEPAWKLGPWASGLNTLTCGSLVGRATPGGLIGEVGYPSPFTRCGPGMADAPVPEFGASGGDCDERFQCGEELGVFGINRDGLWESHCGTSFAAPLLAREAAITLALLQSRCPDETRPFGVTAKAFLALTARYPGKPPSEKHWVRRTLGRGRASADRLATPEGASAVFLWQGILDRPGVLARVRVPVPEGWRRAAEDPRMKLVCAWDPPVNANVPGLWCCRKVNVTLRHRLDGSALKGRGTGHKSYPLIERVYDLAGIDNPDPSWVVEIVYEQIAEYPMRIEFLPQQRVALALELYDVAGRVSPQAHVLALEIAPTLNRLSAQPIGLGVPIMIRQRG